jgi:hypothetical protein
MLSKQMPTCLLQTWHPPHVHSRLCNTIPSDCIGKGAQKWPRLLWLSFTRIVARMQLRVLGHGTKSVSHYPAICSMFADIKHFESAKNLSFVFFRSVHQKS